MRELKFRCWNGEQMVSPDYIDRDGIAHWKENSIPTSSKEVMQYTGLKDKNGDEIYDGDILKVSYRIGHGTPEYLSDGYYKVILIPAEGLRLWFIKLAWEDGAKNQYPLYLSLVFGVHIGIDHMNNTKSLAVVNNWSTYQVSWHSNDIVVAGNIHEHPHLLTK